MKLSKTLRDLSRQAPGIINSQLLHECADQAAELERTIYDDVRDFHLKFDHPAPESPLDLPGDDLIKFRISLIREEAHELCEALYHRNLAAIATEAVDLIYVVVGTLVTLGLPLMPFWRPVQTANMQKTTNPNGGKPLKPEGWVKPDAKGILYTYKQGLR